MARKRSLKNSRNDSQRNSRINTLCPLAGLLATGLSARRRNGSSCPSTFPPGESTSSTRPNPRTHSGHEQNRSATQQGRPGVQLHLGPLEKADMLPRLPTAGALEQSGGKLHEGRSLGQKKLDPHRQPGSRTKDRRDPLRHRELPAAQDPSARVSRGHPGRTGQHHHPVHRRAHARGLGCKNASLKTSLIPIPPPSTVCLAGRIPCNVVSLPRLGGLHHRYHLAA
jgi:hypothetical protein